MLWILVLFGCAGLAQAQPLRVLWDRSGAGSNAWYGVGVFGLGDQDDDGHNDFMVWGLGQAPPGDPDQAVVELFHGGNPPEATPYMRFIADPATEFRFYDVDVAGDINGDGYLDWWIMRLTTDQSVFTFQVYFGGPDADTIPDVVMHPGLSFWIAAQDFNGDGFDDLYARYETNPDSGRMYFGGSPMDTLPDWILHSPPSNPWQAYAWSFGDVNRDGYSDFVSNTSPSISATYIFLGGAEPDTIPAYTWEGFYSPYSHILLDLNGDHYDDLVFHGYPQWTAHLGGPTISRDPSFIMNFVQRCSWNFAASVGDINRDGYNDMVVIDPGCNNLWGTLCLYLGVVG